MSKFRLGALGSVLAWAWCSWPASAQPESGSATSAPAGTPDDSALRDFEKGMTLEQATLEAYAMIEIGEAKGEGASAALKKLDGLLGFIRAKEMSNVDADFLFGRMHLLLGRPREAIQYIDRYAASRKGSNDWLAFRFLGDLYFESKYYSMARDKYRKATELSPTQAEPHAGLARAELEQGHPAIAEEHARKAAELDAVKLPAERDPLYHLVLAESLLGQTKLDEALASAGLATELGRSRVKETPGDRQGLEKLETYQGLEERVIRAILKSFPERTIEYVRLTRLVRERADVTHLIRYHNILTSLHSAIQRTAPSTPSDLIVEQAKLLFAVGDTTGARAVLEELLAKDPENAAAKQCLEELPSAPVAAAGP